MKATWEHEQTVSFFLSFFLLGHNLVLFKLAAAILNSWDNKFG